MMRSEAARGELADLARARKGCNHSLGSCLDIEEMGSFTYLQGVEGSDLLHFCSCYYGGQGC